LAQRGDRVTSQHPSLVERLEESKASVTELDSIDIKLLMALAKDARMPQRHLATVLGMSSPGVADRIARLKARGVIRGFNVDIDWDALGFSVVAHVSVVADIGDDQDTVITRLLEIPGVEEVSMVTGQTDIMVRIRVHGLDELKRILLDNIRIDGIRSIQTSISVLQITPPDTAVRLLKTLPEYHDESLYSPRRRHVDPVRPCRVTERKCPLAGPVHLPGTSESPVLQ
jgi:DNA-binding Lrp family transcriptional regulator